MCQRIEASADFATGAKAGSPALGATTREDKKDRRGLLVKIRGKGYEFRLTA